jgi:hypothetical protein
MRRFPPTLAALGLACLGLATSLPAWAQSSPRSQTVEVSSPAPVRHDLDKLCPGAADALADRLVAVAWERAEPAMVDVSFELHGRNLRDVQAQGGPLAYQRALRRAVRHIGCDAHSAQVQRIRFRVQFVDPFDTTTAAAAAAATSAASAAGAGTPVLLRIGGR